MYKYRIISRSTICEMEINNTSFALEINEYFKQLTKDDVLRKHQQYVVEYLKTHNGILVKHDVGSGKSLIMAAILADQLNQVILLSAKSLHNNTRKAIEQYAEKTKKDINVDYTFVTMNASNMITQLKNAVNKNKKINFDAVSALSLDNKTLIIDEAHNLFNSITNGSRNAVTLYNSIMRAKNLKLVFLTATPIVNHPFELVPCYNMIAKKEVLPTAFDEFSNFFIDAENNKIKNKSKFQNRIVGLTSYYGSDYEIKKNTNDYPECLEIKIEKIHMSDYQFQLYAMARELELKEMSFMGNSKGNLQKPKGEFSSSYKRLSRQISNIAYPEYAINYSKKIKFDHDAIRDEDLTTEALRTYAPKWVKILENLQDEKNTGKHLLYSSFVESGINKFARFLVLNGWELVEVDVRTNNDEDESDTDEIVESAEKETEKQNEPTSEVKADISILEKSAEIGSFAEDGSFVNTKSPVESATKSGGKKNSKENKSRHKFIIITGQVEVEDRQIVVDLYNKNNTDDSFIKLIIISGAGAEGLDLKAIKHVHIMEPYWNWMRITQIIGRAVRYLSHDELPKKDRTVQPYIYINDYPTKIEKSNELFKTEKTTDEYMYSRALQFNKLITSFYNAISEASIDCSIHNNNPKLHCRLCTPTGEPLYLDDIRKDMQMRSPCNRMDKKEITADEYIIGENKYAVYEGVVLKFHPELDGYIELERNDPLYSELLVKAGL